MKEKGIERGGRGEIGMCVVMWCCSEMGSDFVTKKGSDFMTRMRTRRLSRKWVSENWYLGFL